MQITYEDHIDKLRAQVNRIMSRVFLDLKQVEQQLHALLPGENVRQLDAAQSV